MGAKIPHRLIHDANLARTMVHIEWLADPNQERWYCTPVAEHTAEIMREMGYDAWVGSTGHSFVIIAEKKVDRWIVDNWGPGKNPVSGKSIVTTVYDPEYDLDGLPIRWPSDGSCAKE